MMMMLVGGGGCIILAHFICEDVRKANRLLTRLEELSASLETNKTTASLELASQVTGWWPTL